MPFGKETGEWLAIRFPYSHHLQEEFERDCETIATRYDGHGDICVPCQGMEGGKLFVKIFKLTLCHPFRKRGNKRQKNTQ